MDKNMKQTLTAKQEGFHRHLIKRFHVIINKLTDPVQAKEEILLSYNVTSSKHLSIDQLKDVCHRLELQTNPYIQGKDQKRKRLIAAIGGWLRAINKKESLAYIKSIACRAAGKQDFNQIPEQQLINLYNAFLKKQRDIQSVDELTQVELEYLGMSN